MDLYETNSNFFIFPIDYNGNSFQRRGCADCNFLHFSHRSLFCISAEYSLFICFVAYIVAYIFHHHEERGYVVHGCWSQAYIFLHPREERGHVVQSWWTHRMHSIEKISDGRVAVLCVDVQQEASKDTRRRKETTATLTSRQRSRTTMWLEIAQYLDYLNT